MKKKYQPPRRHFGKAFKPRLRVLRLIDAVDTQPKYNWLVVLDADLPRLELELANNSEEMQNVWAAGIPKGIPRRHQPAVNVLSFPDEAAIRAFAAGLRPGGRGRHGGKRALWLRFEETG